MHIIYVEMNTQTVKTKFLTITNSVSVFLMCWFDLPPDHFLRIIKRSYQEPVKKFEFPQTEAQEIGWNHRPLVSQLSQKNLQFNASYSTR